MLAEEAFYPVAITDSTGKNLTGGVNYTIHFKPSQIPPVNRLGFWSITMYNSTQRLVPNPINRYWIGADTPGIMYNKDGSLDVYVQPESRTSKTEQLATFSKYQPTIQCGFTFVLA